MAKQMSFKGKAFTKQACFGGQLLKGNARTPRPLDSKLPLHLVLRSHGKVSMRNPHLFKKVKDLVEQIAKKYGITIYNWANVGNHLHLLIRVTKRRLWPAYIRELTGRIARLAKRNEERFWIYKPFTRVVGGWRKAFQQAKDYVTLNQLEAEGVIRRDQIKSLRQLEEIWRDSA